MSAEDLGATAPASDRGGMRQGYQRSRYVDSLGGERGVFVLVERLFPRLRLILVLAVLGPGGWLRPSVPVGIVTV